MVRQALIALGALQATSAADAIARCLASPNMNLKKAAAEALARAGSPAVVPALLAWIAHHDNPGLRALVRAALRAILGRWLVPVVIAALDEPRAPRATELLVDALDGTLTADEVAAIARTRSGAPWLTTLVRGAAAGTLAMTGGAPVDLDAAFARRGLAALLATATARLPDDDEATRLGLRWLDAARDRLALGRALRTPGDADAGGLAALLARRRTARATLTGEDSHALLDRWDALDADARTAGLALLPTDDASLTARIAEAIATRPPTELPPGLGAVAAARWSSHDASWWAMAPPPEPETTRERAVEVIRIDRDRTSPVTVSDAAAVAIARDLIAAGQVDQAIALGTRDALVGPIVAAIAAARGVDEAIHHAERWLEAAPARGVALIHAIAAIGAPAGAVLRRLVRDPRGEVRTRARLLDLLAAIDRDGPTARDFLQDTVAAAHAATGSAAATALLRDARLPERRRLLGRFLDGELGGIAVDLSRRDTAWLAAELRAATGDRRERALMLLGHLDDDDQRDALALAVWRATDDDGPAKDRARALLRAAPVGRLWPQLEPALARGDWTVLDVLGPTAVMPPSLIAQVAARPDQVAHWAAYLDRATSGTLVAPGLAAALLRGLASVTGATARDHLLRVIARLVDWAEPDAAAALAAGLAPVLAGPDRDHALATVLAAVADRDPSGRLDLLLPIARAGDREVTRAIADAVLAAPRTAARLTPTLAAAVARVFAERLGGRDPERIRAILTARARAARTELERAALLDTLDAAIDHPLARVRVHALRLLRMQGDRPRYLRASRRLLADPDPAIVRTAIRVVAFARDRDAADAVTELLGHAQPIVRAAARDGLRVLGVAARPALTRALAHARPDRRAAIAAVIDELDRAVELDEPDDEHDA